MGIDRSSVRRWRAGVRTWLSAVCVLAATASLARAQVQPVDVFSGVWWDGFESQTQPSGQQCLLHRAFQDRADLCTSMPGGAILSPGWNYRCPMLPHEGNVFFGSQAGRSILRLDTPVRRFGAWMGTNAWNVSAPGIVTVSFFDVAGAPIDSVQAAVTPDCVWTWNGWESLGAPIAVIEITNSTHGGAFVHLDDMRADPEGAGVGTAYCGPAALNSTGFAARIAGAGSPFASDNDLTLYANCVPPQTFGLVVFGLQPGLQPGWRAGRGNLCISGPVGEMSSRLGRASSYGDMSFALDLSTLTAPAPPGLGPGDVLFFQVWFRDFHPGETSNLTDGLRVPFL